MPTRSDDAMVTSGVTPASTGRRAQRARAPVVLDVAKPLSIGEIARVLGWSVRRVRRFVDKLAADQPGLVVWLGTHRRVSLSVLRKILPDFGRHLLTAEDADYVMGAVDDSRASLDHVAKRVGELRAAMLDVTRRVEKLEFARAATRRHYIDPAQAELPWGT